MNLTYLTEARFEFSTVLMMVIQTGHFRSKIILKLSMHSHFEFIYLFIYFFLLFDTLERKQYDMLTCSLVYVQ